MKIEIEWQEPLTLRDGSAEGLIFTCDLKQIPNEAGVYVFCRDHGETRSPIYIGKGLDLRRRVTQELNHVKLMNGVKNSGNGKKILLYAIVCTKKGQQIDKVLKVVEPSLINTALLEGFDIFNTQGTKTPVHTIKSSGRKTDHAPFPRVMLKKVK